MRYFTPELYRALQECESPAQAREANLRWESAVQQYHTHLKELRETIPEQPPEERRLIAGMNRLLDLGSLHGAEVREIGFMEGGWRLVVVLREENRVGTLFLFYSLVQDPGITRDVIHPVHRSFPRTWLYDELDREAGATHIVRYAQRESEFPVFRHSILLSDGIELELRFYRIEVLELRPLLDTEQPALPDDDTLHTIV